MCKYDIYVTYTFCYHIKKNTCQESLKLSSNSNCSSLALRLASEGTFWWFHPERLHHLYYSSSNLYWHTDFLYGIGQLWVNCKSVDQQSRHQITPNCARLAQIKSVFASKTDIKLKKVNSNILLFYWFLMASYQLQLPHIFKFISFFKRTISKAPASKVMPPLFWQSQIQTEAINKEFPSAWNMERW